LGNWIQSKDIDGKEYLIDLDEDKIVYVFADKLHGQYVVMCLLKSEKVITIPCDSEIESQMVYAKLRKMFGLNEELMKLFSNSIFSNKMLSEKSLNRRKETNEQTSRT